jgi:hypothetical protein
LRPLAFRARAPAPPLCKPADSFKPTNHMRPARRRRFYLAVVVDRPAAAPRQALPDRRRPVKARAARARLRWLAALTGQRRPGSLVTKRSRLCVSAIAPVATDERATA